MVFEAAGAKTISSIAIMGRPVVKQTCADAARHMVPPCLREPLGE